MKRIKEILISVAFMVILILPFADSLFHFVPEKENKENRVLKAKPEFDINNLDGFPEAFDLYYSDNFDLRNQFLLLNSKLKFQIFNVAPVKGKAFIGNNGWMYTTRLQMDTYMGNTLVDAKKLKEYYDIFEYRKNFLDSIDCKYYVVIAPIKTSIYPEFLPLSKRELNHETLTDQIVNLLDTVVGLTLLDLRPALREAKGVVRLYHKTDSHWNDYGSFIAYQEIMNTLSFDFPSLSTNNISNFKIDSAKVNGLVLTNMMGIYEGVYENKITCKPTFNITSKKGTKSDYPVIPYFGYQSEYEQVFVNINDTLPKLLMIRDSFGKTVIPYLNEHFSKSVYIFDGWHHEFNEEIVLNEKPDIYIQLVLEMFIPNIQKHTKKPNK